MLMHSSDEDDQIVVQDVKPKKENDTLLNSIDIDCPNSFDILRRNSSFSSIGTSFLSNVQSFKKRKLSDRSSVMSIISTSTNLTVYSEYEKHKNDKNLLDNEKSNIDKILHEKINNFKLFNIRKFNNKNTKINPDAIKNDITNLILDNLKIESLDINKSLNMQDKFENGGDQKVNYLLLQLYVFVSRCIAYPFGTKYRFDMAPKLPKITSVQLDLARERFKMFLRGELALATDEALFNVIKSYYEDVISSKEVAIIVKGGGWSVNDFCEIFKKQIKIKIKNLPDIKGISKEMVENTWMDKFEFILKGDFDRRKTLHKSIRHRLDVDSKMTKDQLYVMFQKVLHIKKHQHQIIFNLLQLDNADEQAAQIRRELDYRMQISIALQKNKNNFSLCLNKEMDLFYAEELKLSVESLKACLQGVPVARENEDNKSGNIRRIDVTRESDKISKQDLILSFPLEITIKEIKGLNHLVPSKMIFCVYEMEGADKLSTTHTEASNPYWDIQADFTCRYPLPSIKIKLCQESSGFLSLDDKELAKIILNPTLSSSKSAEWYSMTSLKQCPDKNLQIQISVMMEKPRNIKHFGHLLGQGKSVWKKWKLRYFILNQVSQYTFAMCSYIENKSEPSDFLLMDGFTVDYCEPIAGLDGGTSYFMLTKEGDEVIFATKENESVQSWVEAIYRATGQTFKPIMLNKTSLNSSFKSDKEKYKKNTMFDLLVQANPSNFSHQELFFLLQKMTLDFRIQDQFICNLGWLSADQSFILEEYCARYSVRVFMRHLYYIETLLVHAENGFIIDPSLIYQKFSFCVAHIHGNKPDRTYTILHEEKDRFYQVTNKLKIFLEKQITNYRSSFPFGKPEKGLKISLSLLERIIRELSYFESLPQGSNEFVVKEIVPPVPQEIMEGIVAKCLSQSTLQTYEKLSIQLNIEDGLNGKDCSKKLELLMDLAEMCIIFIQQIFEYYTDEFVLYKDLLVHNAELLLSLYLVDLQNIIMSQPINEEMWNSIALFKLLNKFLKSHENFHQGIFQKEICILFSPVIVQYLIMMEFSLEKSINCNFVKETWKIVGSGCAFSKDLLWKLEQLSIFVEDLFWPDPLMAEHLKTRINNITANSITNAIEKILVYFNSKLNKIKHPVDCVLAEDLFVAMNTIVEFSNTFQSDERLKKILESNLNNMLQLFISKQVVEIQAVLSNLSYHDQIPILLAIIAFIKPSEKLAKSFIEYIQISVLQICRNVVDVNFQKRFLEMFYTEHIKLIHEWLSMRSELKLSTHQLQIISNITSKTFQKFKEMNISNEILLSKVYNDIFIRIQTETITSTTLI